jgi:hypothetical protein
LNQVFHQVDRAAMKELGRFELALVAQDISQPIDGARLGGRDAKDLEEIALTLIEQRARPAWVSS